MAGTSVKKRGWAIFIVVNLSIAVMIGLIINSLQNEAIANAAKTATPSTSATQKPEPSQDTQTLFNLNPKVSTTHWVSWAVLDRASGVFAGSNNWRQPTYLMSMIKPWIAADWLNQHPKPSSSVLKELSKMIIDSDDQIARKYFNEQESWDRFTKLCGISDLVARSWSWSLTEMSARDAVLYADCIYSGKATSKKWTDWIVDKMKNVRGDGDFGVRELFQKRTDVATKNGWYFWEGRWYVNCMAVTDKWAMAVLQQWPYKGGDLKHGISLANTVCKSVADQVLKLNSL